MTKKEQLFASIYKDYRDKIYRICYGYIYQKDDVDDLFQEVMTNVWNSLDSFRGESQIGTWVYRVAVNSAIFYNRKFKNYQSAKSNLFKEQLGDEPIYDTTDPNSDRLNSLAKAISQLEKQDRLIISLVLEGVPYEEIAEIVGITANYVGVKVSRIKNQLKNLLKDEQ